jgi:hypothetical protein
LLVISNNTTKRARSDYEDCTLQFGTRLSLSVTSAFHVVAMYRVRLSKNVNEGGRTERTGNAAGLEAGWY